MSKTIFSEDLKGDLYHSASKLDSMKSIQSYPLDNVSTSTLDSMGGCTGTFCTFGTFGSQTGCLGSIGCLGTYGCGPDAPQTS